MSNPIAVELTTTPVATRKRIRDLLYASPSVVVSETPPMVPEGSPSTFWFQPTSRVLWIWNNGVFSRVSDTNQEFVISEVEPEYTGLPWFDPSDSSWAIWDPNSQVWVSVAGSPGMAISGPGGIIVVSTTPPENPTSGLLWFDPSDGSTSVWTWLNDEQTIGAFVSQFSVGKYIPPPIEDDTGDFVSDEGETFLTDIGETIKFAPGVGGDSDTFVGADGDTFLTDIGETIIFAAT